MLYRTLGRTGLKVSQLGFGAMHLPMTGSDGNAKVDLDKAVPLMQRAFEFGVNYVDSAVFYCNADSQRAVGMALKGWRDRVIVSTKNHYKETDEKLWHQNLDDSLRLLDIDCIDIYNIHGLSWEAWEKAVVPAIGKWLERARDRGQIRHVCASCHDTPGNMIRLIDTGFFESFTVQYNLLNRSYEPAIAHAKAKNVGIVVMGPLAGGRVVEMGPAFTPVLPGSSRMAEIAMRFVLANPGVSLAISGMQTVAEVEQNVRTAGEVAPLSPVDLAAIDAHLMQLKAAADLYCTGCEYCQPCPQSVRIPKIFNTYNLARIYKNWAAARRDYDFIPRNPWDEGGRDATACNNCGACEKKCPQNIPIRKQLQEAHDALKDAAK